MRRLMIAAALTLALGGCATFNNPLTQNQLYTAKNAYGIALSAATNYRRACVKRLPQVYPQCETIVPKLQVADRNVQGAIFAAESFIKNNPTISPVSLIGAIETALSDFQAIEAKYSVTNFGAK